MTKALVFETPGLMEVRSLILMGTSAKPNSDNPIGRFGTGLKYAVAALTRLGTPPVIYIGRNRYDFIQAQGEFRGSEVGLIELVGLFDRRELPYTTSYGAHWEPWMVYRELEANTRDESGTTLVVSDTDKVVASEATPKIVVASDALIACHEARDSIFLPNAAREHKAYSDPELEVFDAPSSHVYWRGMRVYDLPRPALRTYNLLVNVDLTEDRTLKYPSILDHYLVNHLAKTDDERLILDVIRADKTAFEAGLSYEYTSAAPGPTLVQAATSEPGIAASAIGRYVGKHLPRPERAEPTTWTRFPRPWRVDGFAITDTHGNEVLLATPTNSELRPEETEQLLRDVVAKVNGAIVDPDDGDID